MIGYWMVYAAAAALPVLLSALVVSAALRRHGKPERGAWTAALGLATMLPVVAYFAPSVGASEVLIPLPATGIIGLPEIVAVPAQPSGLGLADVLIFAWVILSAALAIRWAVAAFRLSRLGSSWRPATVDGVSVWLTRDLGPAVSGVFRPRILVPSWLASLPPRQRSLVLLHEEEHLRARDPLLMAFARVARVLTPWNPVVWILSSRLLDAVELDCDRRVLARHPETGVYGATLLDVAARGSGGLVAAAAFAEPAGPLHKRIVAMTTPRRTVSVLGILTAGVLGVVLLLGACEVPVPVRISVDVTVERVGDDGEEAAKEELVRKDAASATERELDRREEAAASRAAIQARIEGQRDEEGTAGRDDAEPPTVEEAITELQRRRQARPSEGEQAPPVVPGRTPEEEELGETPTFTPFTVPPSILNREEVVAAMEAEYPPLLRAAGVGGSVRVYFFIRADGTVGDVRVDQSSGHQALDEAAVAVAGVYRFTPALNRDEPVPVWVSFPITFRVPSPVEMSARDGRPDLRLDEARELYVNGVLFEGEPSDLDADDIERIEVHKLTNRVYIYMK